MRHLLLVLNRTINYFFFLIVQCVRKEGEEATEKDKKDAVICSSSPAEVTQKSH